MSYRQVGPICKFFLLLFYLFPSLLLISSSLSLSLSLPPDARPVPLPSSAPSSAAHRHGPPLPRARQRATERFLRRRAQPLSASSAGELVWRQIGAERGPARARAAAGRSEARTTAGWSGARPRVRGQRGAGVGASSCGGSISSTGRCYPSSSATATEHSPATPSVIGDRRSSSSSSQRAAHPT